MVRHVILWKLKDGYSEEEKKNIRQGIQQGLEGLQGKVPGLLKIKVRTDFLESSNADVMLDCELVDETALKGYAVHPAHVAVANEKVRPFTQIRLCMDFRE